MNSVTQLHDISVPRPYQTSVDQHLFALHVFCDASEQAYSSCVYFQSESSSDGDLKSSFVISKTRLAPVKRVALPRLELLSCLLGAKLLQKVITILKMHDTKIFCWSDSTIAVSWIRSSANRFKPFVSNRVQIIQSITSPSSWNHCSGITNPADQATRPISFSNWNKSLWFNGPPWLNSISEWPDTCTSASLGEECLSDGEESKQELKGKSVAFSSLSKAESSESVFDISKYSSLKKTVRIWCQVRRAVGLFIYLLKFRKQNKEADAKRMKKCITHEEYKGCLSELIQMEQKQFFAEEIEFLKTNTRKVFKRS